MSNILLENDLEEVKEQFEVTNLQGATWCFRKLRAIEDKIEDITSVAAMEIDRITEWLASETKSLEEDKAYFEGLLNAYYIKERAKDKKFKLSTPYGRVISRKTKKWNYDDEVVKAYVKAEDLPFIRVKEELDKAIIEDLLSMMEKYNEDYTNTFVSLTTKNNMDKGMFISDEFK